MGGHGRHPIYGIEFLFAVLWLVIESIMPEKLLIESLIVFLEKNPNILFQL